MQLPAFADAVFRRTYAMTPTETWPQTAARVANAVADTPRQRETFEELIASRVFIPGGRYLYAAGRPLQQFSNCFGFVAHDSREGWADILRNAVMCLATTGGVGINYSSLRPKGTPITRMGGESSGPIALMQMVNEVARHVRSGGSRRSALWAGLHWKHPDIRDFIHVKDWNDDIRAMKSKSFDYPAPLDMTNVSVIIDREYLDGLRLGNADVWRLHREICALAARTGEPAFRNDALITRDDPDAVTGNPCVPAYVQFLTKERGYQRLDNLVVGEQIWTGQQWANLLARWSTGRKVVHRYVLSNGMSLDATPDHRVRERGAMLPVSAVKSIDVGLGDGTGNGMAMAHAIAAGLVHGDGATTTASGATKKAWLCVGRNDADVEAFLDTHNYVAAIIDNRAGHYCVLNVSPDDLFVPRMPLPKRALHPFWMSASPEAQRGFLRGLFSANGSVLVNRARARVTLKTSCHEQAKQVQLVLTRLGYRAYITTCRQRTVKWRNGDYLSATSYNVNIAGYEQCKRFRTEIGFLQKYKEEKFDTMITPSSRARQHNVARVVDDTVLGEMEVFDFTVDAPEHTAAVNGVIISNCQEAVLHDNDVCNLGSIVLPRIKSLWHLEEVVRMAIRFLYNGSLRGYYPTDKIASTAQRNRRIGLGIMGLHEFMLARGTGYAWSKAVEETLGVWQGVANDEAQRYATTKGEAIPVATRAIAPTGTISIIAETTSGIEPIFCTAYKRRYQSHGKHLFQYVVDPTAKRLLDHGLSPKNIEDAFALSRNIPSRLDVQARVQQYTDQAISSTVNLPAGYADPNFADIVAAYLPALKGVTFYPDGARSGQPLVPVSIEEALAQEGVVFEEDSEKCLNGVCGL